MKELPIYKSTGLLFEKISELRDYLLSMEDNSLLAFDWETDGLEYDALPLGLALHQDGKNPSFTPFDYYFSKGLPAEDVIDLLNKEFPRFRLFAQNSKFDSMINKMQGIKDENTNIVADTLLMMHCVNPTLEKKLETRVEQDFGYSKQTFEQICGKKWTKIDWAVDGDSLLELLAGYACEDTFWETEIYKYYSSLMDEDAWKIHDKIEMPFMWVLRDMKIRGVRIDVPLLKKMGCEISEHLDEYMESIYNCAGCVFNINSSKQKAKVFYEDMGLPILKYTRKGAPSTDADTMETLAEMGYEIGKHMVAYSEVQKLYSGYVLSIPKMVDEFNILRGDFNSAGTETGRLSSSNPNLQNQPNNDRFPIRKSFIPRDGYWFVNYDFSQIELRVMAIMSKDKHFTEIFMNDEDPHGDVAKRLGITRKRAKICNFGVLYGMGVDKFAHSFGVSNPEAKKIIDDYHTTYDGFASWKERVERSVRKKGYVKTLFGRVRRLPDAMIDIDAIKYSKDPHDVSLKIRYYAALRQAVNAKIQGTAADLMKLCTIETARRFKEENLDAHLLLQVHDENLSEARINQALQAEYIMKDTMENFIKFDIPIKADGKIIKDWSEMKNDDVISVPYRFDYGLMSSLW